MLWPDDGTWYKGLVEECDVAAKKASSCTPGRACLQQQLEEGRGAHITPAVMPAAKAGRWRLLHCVVSSCCAAM